MRQQKQKVEEGWDGGGGGGKGGALKSCVRYSLTDSSYDFLSLLRFNEELELPLTAEGLHPTQLAASSAGHIGPFMVLITAQS